MISFLYLFILIVALYLFLTILSGLLPFTKKMNLYKRIAGIGFLSLPIIWALRYYLSNDLAPYIFFDSLSHLALGLLFAHFMCLPDRALTLRLLVEILEANDHKLSLLEINSKFDLEQMIQSRLNQMIDSNMISLDDNGAICLEEKGAKLGRMIVLGRSFFGISSAN